MNTNSIFGVKAKQSPVDHRSKPSENGRWLITLGIALILAAILVVVLR